MPKPTSCDCGTCDKCRTVKRRAKLNAPLEWPAEYFGLRLASCYTQYFGETAKISRAPRYSAQE